MCKTGGGGGKKKKKKKNGPKIKVYAKETFDGKK